MPVDSGRTLGRGDCWQPHGCPAGNRGRLARQIQLPLSCSRRGRASSARLYPGSALWSQNHSPAGRPSAARLALARYLLGMFLAVGPIPTDNPEPAPPMTGPPCYTSYSPVKGGGCSFGAVSFWAWARYTLHTLALRLLDARDFRAPGSRPDMDSQSCRRKSNRCSLAGTALPWPVLSSHEIRNPKAAAMAYPCGFSLVGARGFEPPTSRTRTV